VASLLCQQRSRERFFWAEKARTIFLSLRHFRLTYALGPHWARFRPFIVSGYKPWSLPFSASPEQRESLMTTSLVLLSRRTAISFNSWIFYRRSFLRKRDSRAALNFMQLLNPLSSVEARVCFWQPTAVPFFTTIFGILNSMSLSSSCSRFIFLLDFLFWRLFRSPSLRDASGASDGRLWAAWPTVSLWLFNRCTENLFPCLLFT
jgi:hypothetical protein